MVVIWYVIRVFRFLYVAANFSRPFMCLMSVVVGSKGASFRCCVWSSSRRATDWNCDGRGLHTASSPSNFSSQTDRPDPCWIQGRPHCSWRPATDGLLPLYRRFFVVGGAEPLHDYLYSLQSPIHVRNLSNRDGLYCQPELLIISNLVLESTMIHLLGTTVIHLANVVLQLLHSLWVPTAAVWEVRYCAYWEGSGECEEEGMRSAKHSSRPCYIGKGHHVLLRRSFGTPSLQ
jgi:hypothetical protein